MGTGAGVLLSGLAGCSENSSAPGTATDTSTPNGGDETRLDFVAARSPTEAEFNRWNVSNLAQTYLKYFTTPVGRAFSDGSIQSDILEEFTVDGKDLVLTFPSGWTYWNGRDLKAEDYYIQLEINRLMDPESSDYASHELVDDRTIRRTFKESVTPTLMKASVVGTWLDTPRWIYRDFLERLQDASGTEERESVTEELIQKSVDVDEFLEEGFGNGLYRITEYSSAETLTEKFEDHPYADRTDVEKTRIVPVGDNQRSLETQGKMDMTPFGYITNQSIYPDSIKNQFKLNWYRTQKFVLNQNNEHLAKRPVRRAVLSAIDLESVVAATGDTYIGEPSQLQTGLRSSLHDEFLGEGFLNDLITYPVGADADAATEYMRQAEYTKQDDTWVDSSGNPVSLRILTSSDVGQTQPTKVLNDQLNSFGIQTEMNSVGENYYSKFQEYSFDIGWMWHVSKAMWHPSSYFSNQFTGTYVGEPSEGEQTGPTGIPFSVEIPAQVGATELDGDTTEIQPVELMNELTSSSSRERTKEVTRTLSQWFNFDLPGIVYLQENSGYWGNEANFAFPNEDNHKIDTENPGQYAWMQGRISRS